MRVLVLGGTQFIGRFLVIELMQGGHEVTIFHRGKTNQGLFEGVTEVLGDRNEGFMALGDGPWDVVVDTCAYQPSQTKSAIEYFKGKVEHFVFVSTRSVYDKTDRNLTEESPRLPAILEDCEITGETYGGLKVGCEDLLNEGWDGPLTHIRPGVVIGPHDPTDRFTYWPLRFSLGGRVLVPGALDERVTGVDVRDLASFMALTVEKTLVGAWNVDNAGTTFGDIVRATQKVAAGGTETVVVPVADLNGLAEAWKDFPIWAGGTMSDADPSKAVGSGLKYRGLDETVRDTLAWAEAEGRSIPLKAGWDLDREAEVLRQLGV